MDERLVIKGDGDEYSDGKGDDSDEDRDGQGGENKVVDDDEHDEAPRNTESSLCFINVGLRSVLIIYTLGKVRKLSIGDNIFTTGLTGSIAMTLALPMLNTTCTRFP